MDTLKEISQQINSGGVPKKHDIYMMIVKIHFREYQAQEKDEEQTLDSQQKSKEIENT